MITTLIVYLCTSAAMDDCQAHAYHQWNGPYQTEACLASLELTLDDLRREGLQNVAATCAQEQDK